MTIKNIIGCVIVEILFYSQEKHLNKNDGTLTFIR